MLFQPMLFQYIILLSQGQNLSPMLISLFVNDLETFMDNSGSQGISILNHDFENYVLTYLNIIVLLYADDSVIFKDSETVLQTALHNFQLCCKICVWKLTLIEPK